MMEGGEGVVLRTMMYAYSHVFPHMSFSLCDTIYL